MSIRGRCITLTLAVILLLSVVTRHVADAANVTGSSNTTSGGGTSGGGTSGGGSSGSGGSGGSGGGGTTVEPGGHASSLAYSLLTCSISLILACLL